MATFTSWSDELTRFKNALASMDEERLLQSGYTTVDGQTVTFKKFKDIQAYLDLLTQRANQDSQSGGRRRLFVPMGFRGR